MFNFNLSVKIYRSIVLFLSYINMLGRLFGMCMVFNIQWAGLAFSKYLLFLSFIYADFFFLLVTDNQSVRYPEKNML